MENEESLALTESIEQLKIYNFFNSIDGLNSNSDGNELDAILAVVEKYSYFTMKIIVQIYVLFAAVLVFKLPFHVLEAGKFFFSLLKNLLKFSSKIGSKLKGFMLKKFLKKE